MKLAQGFLLRTVRVNAMIADGLKKYFFLSYEYIS